MFLVKFLMEVIMLSHQLSSKPNLKVSGWKVEFCQKSETSKTSKICQLFQYSKLHTYFKYCLLWILDPSLAQLFVVPLCSSSTITAGSSSSRAWDNRNVRMSLWCQGTGPQPVQSRGWGLVQGQLQHTVPLVSIYLLDSCPLFILCKHFIWS